MSGVLAGLILCGLVVLVLLARRESGDVLQRVSLFLYKRLRMWGFFRRVIQKEERQIVGSLMSLHPGTAPTELLTEYYVGKVRMVLLVLGTGSLLVFGLGMVRETEGASMTGGIVSRGEESQTIFLEARVEDKDGDIREEISLEVEKRILPQQELQVLYEEFSGHLDKLIVGDNKSLQEVRHHLYLPDEVEGYPFLIQWISGDSSLLGNDGEVKTEALEQAAEVSLRAEMSYEDWEWRKSWLITLLPPIRTEREQLVYDLKKYSSEAATDHMYEENFALPESLDGKKVSWRMKEEDTGLLLLVLTVVCAVVVYRLKDRDLESDLLERRTEIREAYPELVSKYALFLGAGMTVRGAFLKICHDYYGKFAEERQKDKADGLVIGPFPIAARKGKRAHPLYQEMLYACNELRTGVSESKVYESFGLRTGVTEYTRLCTLLNQNLKKGNSTLVQRLREECEEALLEGNRMKKRRGEEAGTKLLLPMIMMLLMVLLMIMLPAFSGLGV